jgi:hypothetical protein
MADRCRGDPAGLAGCALFVKELIEYCRFPLRPRRAAFGFSPLVRFFGLGYLPIRLTWLPSNNGRFPGSGTYKTYKTGF